jgi:Icc-related predicted phosphoesterase
MVEREKVTTVKVAAVADLHYTAETEASVVPALCEVARQGDILLICGDLTHHGLVEEAVALARCVEQIPVPILAVLGNHDFHSGQEEAIKAALRGSPIQVLDGDVAVVRDIGFAGVKGFGSGFGRRVLEPWGEAVMKEFVRVSVDEAMKLESALARLRTEHRIAILHYAPIVGTVEGEPPEIHAFLGSSRLEDPLNRHQVIAAFHGHAHHGRPEGRTSTGIPVYNVSLPLLRRTRPERPPCRVLEIQVVTPAPGPGGL